MRAILQLQKYDRSVSFNRIGDSPHAGNSYPAVFNWSNMFLGSIYSLLNFVS